MSDKDKNVSDYYSEFNASTLDLERFDYLLRKMDTAVMEITRGNRIAVIDLFSALQAFYINIRPILLDDTRDEYDRKIDGVFKKVTEIEKRYRITQENESEIRISDDFINDVLDLLKKIIFMRQMLGLGFIVRRKRKVGEWKI